jgi:hypothetical protein
MTRNSILGKLLVALLSLHVITAFVPPQQLVAKHHLKVFVDNDVERTASAAAANVPIMEKIGRFATTAAVVIASSPLMALAEEADDYEYGAVNAPIGIAFAGGVLAILTALLPIALQGGEKAFDEMKERDADKWGTGDSSGLDRRKRR